MVYKGLSDYKVKKIIRHFCEDVTASKTAVLLDINCNTINKYFNFGARRIRGKRGRGAAGKTPVFGLLKRDGDVYVEVVKNCSREQLMPVIQGKILEGSTVYTDGWKEVYYLL